MSDPERSEGPGWRPGAGTGISAPDPRLGPSLRSGLAAAIAVLFATNIYRAVTQSVVHDEALAYQWFVAHPWSKMFSSFDVNHHVLHTILVKAVVDLAGLSPLTLRIPALLGGLLYLIFCALICLRLFTRTSHILLAFASLALNPFLLDFLVAARGYGLALGLFAWQIHELIRALQSSASRPVRAFRASVAGGLTVAANLTFAFAVLSASLVFLWLAARKESPESGKGMWTRHFASLVLWTVLPGPVIGAAIVAAPLSYAKPVMFYSGFSQPEASLDSLLGPTLCHGGGLRPNPVCALYRLAPLRIAFWAAVALSLLVAAVTTLKWNTDGSQRFLGMTLATTAGILMLSNALSGLRYPGGRTGLYLIFLATLAGALSLVNLSTLANTRLLRLATLPLWILAGTFFLQFNVRYFFTWRYDAANARMFSMVAHSSPVGRPIWICTQWVYVPSLTFYRTLYHDDGVRIDAQKRTRCDYLILDHEDRFIGFNYAEERATVPAQEVMKDMISGTTLLKSR